MAAKYGDYIVENEIAESWKREQIELKTKLIAADYVDWGTSPDNTFSCLKLIGGVDISFPKGDDDHACACLVVLTYPELEVVYEDLAMVHLTSPYVPEFLAFREVGFLVDLISNLKKQKPEILPQVILVDGNGLLHPRGFGIACHLGVLTDLPTVGVAKTLFHVDGIERDSKHAEQIKNRLKKSGDSFPLVGCSGMTWGMALKSTLESCNPIYISVGHKIGLMTAVKLTHSCCQYRVPEPIRQADMRSREYLRKHYDEEMEKCTCRKQHNSEHDSSGDTTHPMKDKKNSKSRAQSDDDKMSRDQVNDQPNEENITDLANDTFQRLDDLKLNR